MGHEIPALFPMMAFQPEAKSKQAKEVAYLY